MVLAFFNILTGYFLINLPSLISKEYAVRIAIALKITTGEKSLTHFGFTTSKECSGQISQKSAEFCYTVNSVIHFLIE